MERKRVKRICRILCAFSIVLMAVSAFVAFGSAMCCVHGNVKAVLPLAISLVVFWFASEMADAAERRINGQEQSEGR